MDSRRGNGEGSSRGRGGGGRGRGRGRGGFFDSPAKAERARLAKDTINNVIPNILSHNPKAKAGVEGAIMLRSLLGQPIVTSTNENGTRTQPARPPVRVISSDTYDAAQQLAIQHPGAKVAVLNMCSFFQPGGGVLKGAKAQEETLCMRSTLYPSLRDEFYSFPDDATVYTKDVYVFRSGDNQPLPAAECFYVDVISSAAPRKPDVENGQYAHERDKETMMNKMRQMMRVALHHRVEYLVLGAFGCGAYGNPNKVVANMFRRVIYGNERRTDNETWEGIKEIVFAIYGLDSNYEVFKNVFADGEEVATAASALVADDAGASKTEKELPSVDRPQIVLDNENFPTL